MHARNPAPVPSPGSSVSQMTVADAPLATTVVGSYPQPDWLIDRERLGSRLPPRVRARELWRVPEPYLEEAQDDATRLAVSDMERAGVDVVTDGEMRRESYSNRFATALDGVDLDEPGVALDRTGHENPVPRVDGADPPHATGRGPRRRVPAVDHRSADQDHRPGSVHDDAAGAERLLRRRAEPRARVRGGRQRGAARPQGSRSRHRPDRRAVPPGTPGARARVRGRGDRPRARGNRGRRPSCTPASATRTSSTTASPATRSFASSTAAARRICRSRRHSRTSTPDVLRDVPSKIDRSRSPRPRLERGRDARGRRDRHSQGTRGRCRPNVSLSRPTAG